MEFAAAATIITAGNAMSGDAFTNNLLAFSLPCSIFRGHRFTRPPLLRALRFINDDDDMSSRLIKPDQKLEWSCADFRSCNTTANPTYHSNYSPHHSNDSQGRKKAYRAKRERQVVRDEGVSMMKPSFYSEFAEYVSSVWLHNDLARKYYRKALTQMEMDASCTSNPCGLMAEYAEFVWKAFGNGEEANRVYANAVKDYPEDVQLLGSYASFLWELSDNS